MSKKFKLALKIVELEEGLSKNEIIDLLDKLIEFDDEMEATYMPIEFHQNNISAYGFIFSSYFEELNYDKTELEKIINPILDDSDLEDESNIYTLLDGEKLYMSY